MALKNKIVKSISCWLALAAALLLPTSCWVYSFSGVNISKDLKTMQVDYFPNDALLVNPTLSSYFTTQLQDILTSRTSLQLVKTDGDLVYEGEIVTYDQTSVAPSYDQSTGKTIAGKIRLTIGVKVRFYNTKDETQNIDRTFSYYADANGEGTLSGSEEQRLVEEIVTQLLEDILSATVAQW